jgi:hypothetical protein
METHLSKHSINVSENNNVLAPNYVATHMHPSMSVGGHALYPSLVTIRHFRASLAFS